MAPEQHKESIIERIIGWCGENKFIVISLTILSLLLGTLAMYKVKLDAIPDLSDVQVIVFTEWNGRDPQLVEDQITYPIVSTLSAAPKVKYVRGQTFYGLSFVNVIFEDGTDMYWARARVLEYMNQVSDKLPDNVTPKLGPDATGVGWVFQYALVDKTGQNSLADLRSFQDWVLRYYLQNTPGVAEVASLGGHVRQYQVVVDPNKLLAYNISITKITAAIKNSNNDVGGRVIEFAERDYMIRGRGYIKDLDDIEQVGVGVDKNGTPITVADIAEVRIGPEMRRGLLDIDGKGEAVGGIIVMRYGENALKTINAVKQKLKDIENSLPPGVEIVTGYDRSELILGAIDNLKFKLIEESLIVSLVCLIFLFHFRSALVAILILPAAIILSFIPMTGLGITSNIMSLGGIAIAIGAMVDAAIVMIENAHKWLEQREHAENKAGLEGHESLSAYEKRLLEMTRAQLIINAAKQVGKPLFFSLVIITISFLPVFALQAQSGRLFKPLAYTKTFAMAIASLLSITIVPILMLYFIKGKIRSENRNPISRFLIALYKPVMSATIKYRWIALCIAMLIGVATYYPASETGAEFMPPLNEGSLLFMPTSVPGISISEAKETLQAQDKIIASIPEVDRVYGKIGRARTPTDPAPLSMVETTITLKPKDQWRPGMTFDKIREELREKVNVPGMPSIWWMPIQTRIEMLATGIRSQIGIKVLGPDLEVIEQIAKDIESLLGKNPNTASVFAERVTGGYYIDFDINREKIARYGLTVGNVEEIIETAIGGKNITWTVEGRERYPVNVRYARDFRDDIDALKRVLVPTPNGLQIPIGELADIQIKTGPPMIRDENGMLGGFVFVDTKNIDLSAYVENAKQLITDNVDIPAGYFLSWGGQYQYMQKAKEILTVVIPITLFIIFLLLYLNFKSLAEVLIVFLSLPFALAGGIWLLWLLDYNFSVAVAVGFIALAGVAAETGVVMIVYLDEAWKRLKNEKPDFGVKELYDAVIEGAVMRVRPKMMTVTAIIAGLIPIMWGHGTGAQAMKRIAAPMVGGMVSSTILTLLIIPVIYFLWKKYEVNKREKTS